MAVVVAKVAVVVEAVERATAAAVVEAVAGVTAAKAMVEVGLALLAILPAAADQTLQRAVALSHQMLDYNLI